MMSDNYKKNHYKTVHDEYFSYTKFLSVFAIIVCAFYTIKGLFIGEKPIEGIIKSWISGYCIPILVIVLVVDLRFFLDWLCYSCKKRITIKKGTMHSGIISSEVEVRKPHKSRVDWKYVIELEDFSTYISTAYTTQIPLRTKCTVYILKSICIITDFDV